MSSVPSKKSPMKGYGTAGPALGWLAVLTLVFSGTTITLAAMAQSTGSAECNRSSYASLRCISRDLGGVMDTINTKFDLALAKTEQCTDSEAGCRPFASTAASEMEAGEQRGGDTASQPQDSPPPSQQTDENPPSSPPPVQNVDPNSQPTPSPNPQPNPQPDPQKEQNYETCKVQCTARYDNCVNATNETPVTTGYQGVDPLCEWNHVNECVPLCKDWYQSPVVTKPPVPPIESEAQTCLLKCRTQMALCFKAAKIKYNVTSPKSVPPQAYFDELRLCAVEKDNECRAQCRAWNPNSIAPTQ
ncbi:hypothetical protein IT407_04550 [Candidatus Uhrbacteria bacterium]|nr:hypothetical protein [Candidatus Uhrbacteria bacterium]